MVEVTDKQNANYVVILSNAFTKQLIKKIYYNLDQNEGVGKMIRDASLKYEKYFNTNTRVDFARVMNAITVAEE